MNSKNELQLVHERILSILQFYINLCEKHSLRYYFTGGSLIGVLRHEGFIPWDDDIDLGMPRADYDKFLEICRTELPAHYFLINRHTDPNWKFNMSQLVDKSTEVDIYLTETPRRSNIWIDVFPLDGLPTEENLRHKHMKKILFYRYLVQVANIKTQVDANRKRPLKERIILGICRHLPLHRLISTPKVLEKMEETLRSYDFDSAMYAGNLLGRYREREVVPKAYFGTPQKAYFEGIKVNIPENSHALQTALYGDYMQLPPESERVGHRIKVVR
ncbi:LicD family protein [Streptococcus gallolyticus]|uniref:LicD family protein n=1 Tax=Streptococcus gallolyticus TaxID=315405 RepID=A0A368UF53_9STRE|nr:LicD family protein [Streptococcus gallolyticus]RCW17589.1 LicD family protein [Streptococcus gallolyticus]